MGSAFLPPQDQAPSSIPTGRRQLHFDFLIDFIADCEQQLWDLKRAESFEAYTAFIAAEESRKA